MTQINYEQKTVPNITENRFLGLLIDDALSWKQYIEQLINRLSTKNGVFWVVTPCGSCKNRRFGGTWRLLHQGDKNR
jgi:hypothetical protein